MSVDVKFGSFFLCNNIHSSAAPNPLPPHSPPPTVIPPRLLYLGGIVGNFLALGNSPFNSFVEVRPFFIIMQIILFLLYAVHSHMTNGTFCTKTEIRKIKCTESGKLLPYPSSPLPFLSHHPYHFHWTDIGLETQSWHSPTVQ